MKLVTYLKEGQDQLALIVDGMLYDTDSLHHDLPISMSMFLNYWDDYFPLALAAEQQIKKEISG
jgi:fumarylacetoacetate (FAA) hydrolase